LQAGQYTLVKASVAGAIETNALFMLGASFLLGGLRYHLQEFNSVAARFQAGLLFLATIALLIPSAVAARFVRRKRLNQNPGRGTLIFAFAGIRSRPLVFTQHASRIVRRRGRGTCSGVEVGLALATLAGVTVFVALVSEVFGVLAILVYLIFATALYLLPSSGTT
jgi:Ca2+:H+ antiporter